MKSLYIQSKNNEERRKNVKKLIDNVYHTLRNVKLNRHLVTTGNFFVCRCADDVRVACAKTTAEKIPAEGNFRKFLQSRLKETFLT